jgi:2-polyprenyl-6-methoxyphenol hydroxylase-like FAD-dependent oxidoreductase
VNVVVVGAGLGGLCLAQGLRRSGIGVELYERDSDPASRRQGYRITIKSDGGHALQACLPEPLFQLAIATSIRPARSMAFTDEQLVPKFAKPIPPVEPGVEGFGVNRLTLREILLADLGDTVHFGRTFGRYESTRDGRVRAVFADGTTALADLLVGADGTDSAVRRQLVPDAVVDELACSVYGRTPIGPDTLSWLPDVLTESFNRITAPDGSAMAVATCRAREPLGNAIARLAPGVRLTDVPDYLAWMVTLPDDRLRAADPSTLHSAARDIVRGWHPAAGRIIDEAEVPATFTVVITSAQRVAPWREPAVTLLGDAIHTMSPGRGEGANVALRDASLLCGLLTSVAAARLTLAAAKGQYEAELLEYGFAMVEQSRHHPFAPRR